MSREIKFRAWNNIVGRMSDCYTIEEFHKQEVNFNNITLMQFIGLKDGEKLDIYENDLVEFRANYTNKPCGYLIGQVVFYQNSWMLKVNDDYYSILEETDEFYCYSRVIGNIYKNPELLTKHQK